MACDGLCCRLLSFVETSCSGNGSPPACGPGGWLRGLPRGRLQQGEVDEQDRLETKHAFLVTLPPNRESNRMTSETFKAVSTWEAARTLFALNDR